MLSAFRSMLVGVRGLGRSHGSSWFGKRWVILDWKQRFWFVRGARNQGASVLLGLKRRKGPEESRRSLVERGTNAKIAHTWNRQRGGVSTCVGGEADTILGSAFSDVLYANLIDNRYRSYD